ncbi:MAG: SDR family NAD(P)-dependent oxidoreductase [Ruminococcus sp.]|nr:SDR family NAD(P)-dependent oxidoreductase [Candidatus Copronaster equi]
MDNWFKSDIAKTFVKKYASEFGTVILASKNYSKVCEFKSELNNDSVFTFEIDISDKKSIDDFISKAPSPDIVIIFAGHIQYSDEKEDVSSENIARTFRTNAEGTAIFLEKTYEKFLQKHGGTVVALSSCAGERGKSSNRIYAASKAALSVYLEGFMQTAEKDNIKTVLIKLGRADTKMLEKVSSKKQKMFSCSSEQVADYIMKKIKQNKSKICYYKKIWKPVITAYRMIPLYIYNKIDF